jgi:hypothetical protein
MVTSVVSRTNVLLVIRSISECEQNGRRLMSNGYDHGGNTNGMAMGEIGDLGDVDEVR